MEPGVEELIREKGHESAEPLYALRQARVRDSISLPGLGESYRLTYPKFVITAVCKNNGTRIKIKTYYDVAGLRKIAPIGDLVESCASSPLLLRWIFVAWMQFKPK